MTTTELAEAFEIVRGGDRAPLLLTCEHASERLPEPWRWPERDLRLVGTHWAFDLGAADLTRELAARTSCVGVLSRFSRLLVDANRGEDEPSIFRDRAEGAPVALNETVESWDSQYAPSTQPQPFSFAPLLVCRFRVRAVVVPMRKSGAPAAVTASENWAKSESLNLLFAVARIRTQTWYAVPASALKVNSSESAGCASALSGDCQPLSAPDSSWPPAAELSATRVQLPVSLVASTAYRTTSGGAA